jgi:hypothetical protein
VKIGGAVYRFHHCRDIAGRIKTATIGRDVVEDFWITFSVETAQAAPDRVATGTTTPRSISSVRACAFTLASRVIAWRSRVRPASEGCGRRSLESPSLQGGEDVKKS